MIAITITAHDDPAALAASAGSTRFYVEPTNEDGTEAVLILDDVDDAPKGATRAQLAAGADFLEACAAGRAFWIAGQIADLEAGIVWVAAIAAQEVRGVRPAIDVMLAMQEALAQVPENLLDGATGRDAIKAAQDAVVDFEVVTVNASAAKAAADAYRAYADEQIAALRNHIPQEGS